jgi:AraC-like DNA-binding protein
MKEAEKLLLGSNMSIQRISYEIGFRNANYFSRVFKQKHNITPREYKAQKNI